MSTPSRHVIFRSRGCRTCRARKVKCDQTHPFCQRCAGSGLKCRGYSEPTTFLHENPQSTDLSLSAEPRALPYPAESKHIAFLAKCLAFETLGDKKGYAWLRNGLCASEDRSYLLFTSSRCLAYVFYGRHFKQHRTITDGMDGYGKMLRVLRGELSKPMAVTTGDLLQVIVTSILVESVIAPTMGNFNFGGLHAHIDGLARILQMRGPKAFQQKLELQPFQVCRCYIIGRAINTRTPTFLAEAQWKALPWQYEEKGSLMELWDILSDVPSFLFDLERLHLASITWPLLESINWPILEVKGLLVNPKHRLSINLRSLLQSLFHWRWKWERHFNITADVIPTDPNNTAVTDNHGNPQFTTCLSYSDLFAREIIYYQAILVFLLRLGKLLLSYNLLDDVDKAAPPSLAQPLRPSPLLLPSDVHSLEDASSEFYRSMEGHLCGGRDKAAVEFYQLMFALSLVTLGVENDSIEAIWTKRIRGRMIGASGFDMWAACRERSIGSIADSKP